jgi:hypothetical protein
MLMHKDIYVAGILIDKTGYISRVMDVLEIRRLPPGIHVLKTGIDRKALNDWWTGRSIPASRMGIGEALERIGITLPALLAEKCFGLSLSDHYWICPGDSGLKWADVNFFHNGFSKDMGELLFGSESGVDGQVNFMSPDNTSDGWLRKKWIIVNGKRLLMKGGSGVYQQEPFNEVIASALMRRLNVDHITYTLSFDNGQPYSLCENFVTPETELIPAWHVLRTRKQPNNVSVFNHFINCCDELGAPDVKSALNKMLTVDYIISNEDRHFHNFGLIRDPDTLEWLGLAPIYDSGTSLWHNTLRVGSPVECKPFRKNHIEQIALVDDFTWFDTKPTAGLDNEIINILFQSTEIDEKRREAIATAMMVRCEHIEKLAEKNQKKPY